jgi:hypothetical protein
VIWKPQEKGGHNPRWVAAPQGEREREKKKVKIIHNIMQI